MYVVSHKESCDILLLNANEILTRVRLWTHSLHYDRMFISLFVILTDTLVLLPSICAHKLTLVFTLLLKLSI